MKPVISVIGTGRMGSALVTAFLKSGYKTHIWNRTSAKYAPLVELGAMGAVTVQAATAEAEIVVVNVSDYAASNQLLDSTEIRSALAGKLLVQLTSGSPRQARDGAAWAEKHGIHYLDGAIMGTPNFVGTPGGTILYAGPEDRFHQRHEVFLALGGNPQHVGADFGHASALDAALLGQMWGALYGALLGAVVSEAEGIPHELFLAYLAAFKPVVDDGVIDVATRVRDGRLAGDEKTLATIDAHYGAFRALIELCKERGIDRAVPDALDGLFRTAIDAGRAQDDFAALSAFMRQSTNAAAAKGYK